MYTLSRFFVFFVIFHFVSSTIEENASYKNPNPRPYDNCEVNDLIKFSECCNDVLSRLDDCKAGDLACECCALQSMDNGCYNLCPGNPSTNFLSVLLSDCSAFNDVNACNIPFKKLDGNKPSSYKHHLPNSPEVSTSTEASIQSTIDENTNSNLVSQEETTETVSKPKPRVNLLSNITNTQPNSAGSVCLEFSLAAMAGFWALFVYHSG